MQQKPPADGAIQISHDAPPEVVAELPQDNSAEIRIDTSGNLHNQFSDDYEVPDLTPTTSSEPVLPAPSTPEPTTESNVPDLGNARGAVESAMDSQPATHLPPIAALNAQSVFDSQDSLFDAPGDEERPSGEPAYGMPQLLDQQFRSSINPSTGGICCTSTTRSAPEHYGYAYAYDYAITSPTTCWPRC